MEGRGRWALSKGLHVWGTAMKKMILMGLIGLLALALLGGGGFFAYKKFFAKKPEVAAAPGGEAAKGEGKEGEAKDAHPEGDEEEAEESAEKGAPAVMVYKGIVNLDRKNAYLKVELHILFRDPELGKAATSDKPTPENSQIRSVLLEALSGRTLEEVSDVEMREGLRVEIKDKLNERFAPKPKPDEKEDPKHKKPKKPVKDVLVVDWAVAS